MSNTAEPRGKKESPTENRRTFTRKGGLVGGVGSPYFSTTSELSFKVNHSFV